jgi:serine/threonine protein phosphatase PrpC
LIAQTGLCSACGRREANEDYAGIICKAADAQALVVAAVADGVGGAKGGRVAAETAVRAFIDGCVGQMPRTSAKQAALGSLEAANRWLHATSRRDADLAGMSCTFTALVCAGRRAHVVHVGDSRLYRLRGERLELLTTDHNAGPGLAHVLTRAVGAEEDVRMDYLSLQNDPFDRYLLCTDGVHGGLGDAVLRELLGSRRGADETARAAALAIFLMLAVFFLAQSRQHALPARHGAGRRDICQCLRALTFRLSAFADMW